MRSFLNLYSIVLTMITTAVVFAAPSVVDKNAQVLNLLMSGEVQIEEGRDRLSKLSMADIDAFVGQAQTYLDGKPERRQAAVFAYEILSRRPEFSKEMASKLLPYFRVSKIGASSRTESRLVIFLQARAGLLTEARIQEELKSLAVTTQPSTDRLAKMAALIDAMSEARRRPSTAQLETLLQNDVFEIRMLAVDWFRMHTPETVSDRKRFLLQAMKANPVQVRERAYRTIASWEPEAVKAVGAELVSKNCEKDSSAIIRTACVEIRSKAGRP